MIGNLRPSLLDALAERKRISRFSIAPVFGFQRAMTPSSISSDSCLGEGVALLRESMPRSGLCKR